MKILVIEDDSHKLMRILDVIKNSISMPQIKHLDSVYGAVRYLSTESPDKIILDMSLPSHPPSIGEGSPVAMPAGGIEILLEMRSLRKANIPTVILTQYPDVEIEDEYYTIDQAPNALTEFFGFTKINVIYYDTTNDDWINPITIFLKQDEIFTN
jgi:CheY-like chemotaxis protein